MNWLRNGNKGNNGEKPLIFLLYVFGIDVAVSACWLSGDSNSYVLSAINETDK